jgi:hypothetical protein
MQEAKSQADVQMAGRTDQQALNEERLRLYEKLSEAEKSKADAQSPSVFQQALKGQQDAVAQMIGGLAAAHTPRQAAIASPAAPPPVAAVGAEWHVATRRGPVGAAHTSSRCRRCSNGASSLAEALVWKAGMGGLGHRDRVR